VANLRKIKDNYYARIRVKINHQLTEKLIPLKTKNPAKAKRLLKQINEQENLARQGILVPEKIIVQDPLALDDIIDEYLDYRNIQNISASTLSIDNLSLKALQDYLKGRDIRYLSKKDYLTFMQSMRKRYRNLNALNIRLRSLKTFLNWAVENDKLKELPFRIEQVSINKRRPRYFSDAELNSICEYIRKAGNIELLNRVILHVNTGLRLRELHTSHIEKNVIQIYRSKGGTERSIPVNPELANIYTFCKQGKYTDWTISKMFGKVLEELNLKRLPSGDKRTFHCLRHTFAVKTYHKEKDIYKVSKLLGHSKVTTTQIYADFDNAQLENDFRKSTEDTLAEVIDFFD